MTDHDLTRVGVDVRPRAVGSRIALARQRYQLAGGLVLAALLPLLVWGVMGEMSALGEYAQTTLIVCLAALFGHIFVQELARYPGESPLSTSLPAVSAGFGILVVIITLTHAPYSRGLLIAGYVIAVLWYSALGFIKGQHLRPSLTVVPLGDAAGMNQITGADWHTLSAPSIALCEKTQGVVADLGADLSPEWREFLTSCAVKGIPVYDSKRARELMTGQVGLRHISDIGFEALLPHRSYFFVKGMIDFVIAALLLPLALLVIGLAVIAVRLETKGPAFFIQNRIGYRGHIFRCIKIRSMRTDQPSDASHFTTDGDPRITRVGKFLRKYRIDELPQIFNILKGEMSWIGPRPEAVELAQLYERNIPYYAFRHSVKPGISGWAAVRQGNVAEVSAATAKLRYDFFYIKNLSLSLDTVIAAKTIWVLLTGAGSK